MSYYFTRNEMESHHEANLEEDPLGTGEQRVQQQWKCDLLILIPCSWEFGTGITNN